MVLFADYIDEVLQEDCDDQEPRREGDDGGITFTAKSPRRYSAWTPCVTPRLELNTICSNLLVLHLNACSVRTKLTKIKKNQMRYWHDFTSLCFINYNYSHLNISLFSKYSNPSCNWCCDNRTYFHLLCTSSL